MEMRKISSISAKSMGPQIIQDRSYTSLHNPRTPRDDLAFAGQGSAPPSPLYSSADHAHDTFPQPPARAEIIAGNMSSPEGPHPTGELHENWLGNKLTASQRRSILQKHGNVANLIQNVLGFRVEVDTQYAVLGGYRKSAIEAFARLHAAQKRVYSEGGFKAEKKNLDRMFQQADEEYKVLQMMEEKQLQRVEELGRIEFKLSERERAAQNLLEGLLAAEDDYALISSILLNDDNSNKSDLTEYAEPDPQLVLDFYDRSGDIGIYRDRLHNLDYEHLREKGLRHARSSRGEPVDPLDDLFFEEYFRDRREIVLDLTAKREGTS
ncbi:hypothetical protein P152DRAFT_4976 [Eremomyces bilateralis CBS 781.70]|uniref:Uncharacterized protein n=1 Tax=Eremomyces bilateralis CBS 781.70 TaxID=1392243 RepID=A0A6G1GG37_9PEZI|nr:uncharacterized protein P152DRAFT_4976 [Eremomyces bilateralis CBS 781.70]KAF1816952.1 hypothetical protein P152DRAFT_4976 [Eremomyces bilateralis CBS 781.70]